MLIQNTEIVPGQNQVVRLSVGRLPSDTKIYLQVCVYRSINPGPSVLVLSGVHGDEINSVEIVRAAVACRMFEKIKCGSVVALPLLNVYGFNNFSRDVPDGKDVNRSFPGSPNGSMAARTAHIFTKNILPVVDLGVDFHTGGNYNFNYPQIRYSKGDARSRELADAFGAPFTVASKPIAKSLRKVALEAGKPILVYEGGENLRFDGYCIEQGLAGIRRLLYAQGMWEEPEPAGESHHIAQSAWLRANRSGMFRWFKSSGQWIKSGEMLGVINDPYGQDETPVASKKDGYIIGHNNNPVVGQGDALFHIGQ